MKYFSIHNNNGSLNEGIGQIICNHFKLEADVFTFYDESGAEVFWYKLAPGEGVSFYDEDDMENLK